MSFWTYLLHCADCTFYVGHTDDLEKRMGEHELGLIPGYTSTRRPVRLVWSEYFETRDEARQAEEQLKGSSKAKKTALIREDWADIAALARGKGKERASEGSAEPVFRFLHPHLGHLPSQPFSLEVSARRRTSGLDLRYRLTGPLDLLRLPQPSASERRDDLWQHTCFEAFARKPGADPYLEFNLSPSGEWAAYIFLSRRAGMTNLAEAGPRIKTNINRYALEVKAYVQLPHEGGPLALNLTAVIEEKSGAKSYWALAHPPEGPPDFHDPACFVLELPPATAS